MPRNDAAKSPSQNKDETSHTTPQKKPDISRGTLQRALLRTLRGDISATRKTDDKETRNTYVPEGGAHTSTLPPTPPPVQPHDSATSPHNAVVHTLRDDVSHMVRNKKMSLVRMAALEGNKGVRTTTKISSNDPWKLTVKMLLIVLVIVFVGVAGATGYYAYRIADTPTQQTHTPGIIFTEGREVLNISDQPSDVVRSLLASIRDTRSFVLGSLTEIVLMQTPRPKTLTDQPRPRHVRIQELLALLQARVPDTFTDNLGEKYMLGMHARELRNEPFLILTTSSYSFAFSGMLKWESTMATDLADIFIHNDAVAQTSFRDDVYENIDVRVLYSTTGSELLVYGFVNRTVLIITTNKNTFLEVVERLQTQSGYSVE